MNKTKQKINTYIKHAIEIGSSGGDLALTEGGFCTSGSGYSGGKDCFEIEQKK